MSERFDALLGVLRRVLMAPLGRLRATSAAAARSFFAAGHRLRGRLVMTVLLGVFAYGLGAAARLWPLAGRGLAA
jgi:hypothetical protein